MLRWRDRDIVRPGVYTRKLTQIILNIIMQSLTQIILCDHAHSSKVHILQDPLGIGIQEKKVIHIQIHVVVK